MKIMHKIGAAAVAGVLFLSACDSQKTEITETAQEMPVSSVNIEKELAERFSVTDENKYLIEDSIQDVYAEADKEGVTLKVLQTIAYENMICILAEADLEEGIEKVTEDYYINAKCDFSVEGRASLHRSGSSEYSYDEEKKSLTYLCTDVFDTPELEEGMTLNLQLSEISKGKEEFPPEAFDENGELREDYDPTEIMWQPEEPLTVSWTLEKIGKSVETDIDDESIVDGKIALTPLYVYVSANKSDYAKWFYPEGQPETDEERLLWVLAEENFAKTVRLVHKNGYYIDAYNQTGVKLHDLSENTGAFNVLKAFFMVLDPEEVEFVEISNQKYKVNKD